MAVFSPGRSPFSSLDLLRHAAAFCGTTRVTRYSVDFGGLLIFPRTTTWRFFGGARISYLLLLLLGRMVWCSPVGPYPGCRYVRPSGGFRRSRSVAKAVGCCWPRKVTYYSVALLARGAWLIRGPLRGPHLCCVWIFPRMNCALRDRYTELRRCRRLLVAARRQAVGRCYSFREW